MLDQSACVDGLNIYIYIYIHILCVNHEIDRPSHTDGELQRDGWDLYLSFPSRVRLHRYP